MEAQWRPCGSSAEAQQRLLEALQPCGGPVEALWRPSGGPAEALWRHDMFSSHSTSPPGQLLRAGDQQQWIHMRLS